jgi:CBS domain-containing protein
MEAFDPVSAVLNSKGGQVWSVPPDATVFDALRLMADKDVGSLLVLDGKKLIGVFSERDYARKIILLGRSSKDTTVGEIMTSSPTTIPSSCAVNEAMRVMTEQRVRHLPVLGTDAALLGVVSIGDLVKWIITSQEAVIEQLHSYIAGQA